jgi:hypothetical protein
MIPTDPMMLLSFINMKLRDEYNSLDALCEDLDIDRADIAERLAAVGYTYNAGYNQFR